MQSYFYDDEIVALDAQVLHPGVYTIQLETVVLRGYRFAPDGKHPVGVWERWPPFLVRAYRCR